MTLMESHLLPIYLRPSILFPIALWSVWGLIVWRCLARYNPAKHPGIIRCFALSPLVWFYTFFWFGMTPILIGVFPDTDSVVRWYERTSWTFILILAYFGIGPRFVINAEARHRNKFGFFTPNGKTSGTWQVDSDAPRVHFVADTEDHQTLRA